MCFSCHEFCLATTVPKKGYSRRCIPYELHACGMVYQRFLQKQAFLWRFLFNITKKKIEISIDHLYTSLLFSVSSSREIKLILVSLLNPFTGREKEKFPWVNVIIGQRTFDNELKCNLWSMGEYRIILQFKPPYDFVF